MPIFDKNQVKFYKTRQQVLQIFRAEERKKCFCSTETWAGSTNKLTCINCIRKENLSKEMDRKEFFKSNKNIKYWKVRRQGRYKELKMAAVYYQPDFVGTLPQSQIEQLAAEMGLSSEEDEESDHGWDD